MGLDDLFGFPACAPSPLPLVEQPDLLFTKLVALERERAKGGLPVWTDSIPLSETLVKNL